jgi:hypothetical protein
MPSRPRTIESPRTAESAADHDGHALNRAGILVRSIHDHHPGRFAGVCMVILADDIAAERVAHKHERSLESCVLRADADPARPFRPSQVQVPTHSPADRPAVRALSA